MSAHTLEITDDRFEQAVIQSELPVLVDFWAPWCGPCRLVAPVLEELARDWDGRLRVVKIDTERNPLNAFGYGVSGIPTMVLFQDGSEVDRVVGALPRARLEQWLERALGDGVAASPALSA